MNTDKLMELERKWRAVAHELSVDGFRVDANNVLRFFDELAAALRAEQAVICRPIERDEQMNRDYIPLPGGWEIQTKGSGSTFRICDKDGDRLAIPDSPYLHETLTRMARDINEASRALGTARQSEGMVLVPRVPTEAMFAAALPLHQRMGQFKLTMIWNAMLAAAPGGEGEG